MPASGASAISPAEKVGVTGVCACMCAREHVFMGVWVCVGL